MTLVLLDLPALPEFAVGCDVLGAGGGGSAAGALPLAAHAIAEHGPVPVVTLTDLHPDDLVMPCAYLGAPDIAMERIGTGHESESIRRQVEAHFGRPVGALMCTEIGGFNGPGSVALAAHAGLPLLDADGMGRAFPGVEQVSMQLAGITPAPAVLADEHERVVLVNAENGRWLERLARQVTAGFGDRGASSEYVMSARDAGTAVVAGSVGKALAIGATLTEAAAEGGTTATVVDRLVERFGGLRLIEGRVTDMRHAHPAGTPMAGNARSAAVVEGIGADASRWLRLEVGHEYLAAVEDGEVRATVPDIISAFDVYSGRPVPADALRYGLRLVIAALPCPPQWLTPAGLDLVGPRAFGLSLDYHPLGVTA
ncbi:DUF917 domain-containing protein [Amycolatopsis suaedae]|uniref:DUF917 domain-containing protein n=1 Tax=Amycolatopsis suaedae TaxID=2510978 RepID=UPI0013EF0166|nr:DUF917 domain-containing protein [Amycolatopsis suaedae]